jgi:hypothetical protein
VDFTLLWCAGESTLRGGGTIDEVLARGGGPAGVLSLREGGTNGVLETIGDGGGNDDACVGVVRVRGVGPERLCGNFLGCGNWGDWRDWRFGISIRMTQSTVCRGRSTLSG